MLCRSPSKLEMSHPLHVVERYIELLCRFEPEQVYTFLKSSDNYRLEEALEVSLSTSLTGIGADKSNIHVDDSHAVVGFIPESCILSL